VTFLRSQELFDRAASVIPGGIYGHTSPALTVPGSFPAYAVRGEGCRYIDVDGNEFIDFMCGYGPILLGYRDPEVEEAAERQRREGDCFNHPTPLMVELAERLVSMIDFAGWAVFGKNGSDMTTWAVQVAREQTKRKKVVVAKGAYHGTHAWCTPGHGGLIEEDRMHVHPFPWNDADALEDLFRKHDGQIAAVVLTPFHHPAYGDMVMPAEGFWSRVEVLCRRAGALLILDDVRAGFRLHEGGSHRAFGFTPDLACYCKALGNGYPISAAVGRPELKVAASKVFLTGSYWNSAVPMAAALKVLEIVGRGGVVPQVRAMGERLLKGLEAAAREHGFEVRCTGPASMPFMSFAGEPHFLTMQAFSAACARRGVFFHPHHNWFLCAAHTVADIDRSLEVARAAFAELRQTGVQETR
jgi:glutamate-1-semialdehyde 2,1-aminomutase